MSCIIASISFFKELCYTLEVSEKMVGLRQAILEGPLCGLGRGMQ